MTIEHRTVPCYATCALLVLVFCGPEDSHPLHAEETEIPGGPVVTFELAPGFQFGITQDTDDGAKPILRFSHYAQSGTKDFLFSVHPVEAQAFWKQDPETPFRVLSNLCDRMIRGWIPGKMPIRKSEGERPLWYCSSADAVFDQSPTLRPGSYRHLTIVFSPCEGYALMATAYSHSVTDQLHQDFMSMMRQMTAGQRKETT